MAVFRQQLLLSYARRVMSLPESHPALVQLRGSMKRWSELALGTLSQGRLPLLYDVLQAEHDWDIKVLPEIKQQQVLAAPEPPAPSSPLLQALHPY